MFGEIKSLAKDIKDGKLSGLARQINVGMVEAEVGALTWAQVYLTNLETEEELQLAPPESVDIKTAAQFRTFNIVELGEISYPKGERLMRVSWHGYLFDAAILLQDVLKDMTLWDKPEEVAKDLLRWKTDGQKVHLLITQTPLDLDVYIKSFNLEPWRLGHFKYDLELEAAKDLITRTVAEADAARAEKEELKSRPPRQKSQLGKQLNEVNNIYNIARILTGKGNLNDVLNVAANYGLDIEGAITGAITDVIF